MADLQLEAVFLGDRVEHLRLVDRAGNGFFDEDVDVVLEEKLSDFIMTFGGRADADGIHLAEQVPVIGVGGHLIESAQLMRAFLKYVANGDNLRFVRKLVKCFEVQGAEMSDADNGQSEFLHMRDEP